MDPNFFLHLFKKNNFQFCDICGYKRRYLYDNEFFSSLSFVAVFGPGSVINIATLFFRLLLKNSLHTSTVFLSLVIHAGGLEPNPDSAKSVDSDQDVVHVFK
jgi:hypothetical protein